MSFCCIHDLYSGTQGAVDFGVQPRYQSFFLLYGENLSLPIPFSIVHTDAVKTIHGRIALSHFPSRPRASTTALSREVTAADEGKENRVSFAGEADPDRGSSNSPRPCYRDHLAGSFSRLAFAVVTQTYLDT